MSAFIATRIRFLLLPLILISASLFATVELKAIRTSCEKAVIALSGSATYKTFMLSNPTRVVLDLDNVMVKQLNQPSFPACIKAARYASRGQNGYRVVFELAETPDLSTTLLKDEPNHGTRLVLNFKNAKTTASKTDHVKVALKENEAIKSEKNKKSEKPVAQKSNNPQFAPLEKIAMPVIAKDTIEPELVSVRTENKKSLLPKRKKFVIALDAGHGGEDPGALGKNGAREKDVALQIAKRLAALINNEAGMQAVLVRKGDYFIELRERMAIARKAGADLFISIHADAFHHPRAKGASVFVLSERGSSSEAARWLADHENRADLVGGVSLSDKSNTLASVLLDLSQTASSAASLELANYLLQGLGRVSPLHRARVEQAGFMVLKSPDIPSVLVETGFISNPEGERFLSTPHSQTHLAEAMLGGIRRYVNSRPYMSLHHDPVPENTARVISRR